MLQANPINNVAGKYYYGYLDENGKWQLKYTGGHNDVLRSKRNNVPFRNNSQEPDSLVLMYLFGNPKELWFKKHYDKTTVKPNSEIRIEQTHGNMVVLDPRDEKWVTEEDSIEPTVWRHSSNMINDDDMSFMLIIRCVRATQEVLPMGQLVDQRTTELRQRKFNEAQALMKSEWYQQRMVDFEMRKREFLRQFKP
jgi:hypothetical protein